MGESSRESTVDRVEARQAGREALKYAMVPEEFLPAGRAPLLAPIGTYVHIRTYVRI